MSIKATIIAYVLAGIPALLSIGALPFYILGVPGDPNTDKSYYHGYTLGLSAIVFYPLLWFLFVVVFFLLNKFFVSDANKPFLNHVGVGFICVIFLCFLIVGGYAARLIIPRGYIVNKVKSTSIKYYYSDPRMRALIKAAEGNDIDKLKYLINEGVDPNTVGKEGMTPLFWTLGHQNKKAMKALLAVGADPNLKNPEGDSPVSLAAGARDAELLKILLDGGGDPNIKNDLGKPALHVAIGQRRIENIKILLDYGADINSTDRTRKTPAMYAANLNKFEIVYFLLNKGADHKHLTRGGVSLAEIVQDSSVNPEFETYEIRKKVIKILEDRGVKFPVRHPSDVQKP